MNDPGEPERSVRTDGSGEPDESDEAGDAGLVVAVTGAAGFIGSRVVGRLRDAHPDWSVRAVDNFYLGEVRRVEDVSIEHVDVRRREALAAALEGADVVCHLAAVSGVDDCEANPGLAHDVNVVGTANVTWVCRETGAGLVFPFSMAVLGDPASFPVTADLERDPLNRYSRTKLVGERTVEAMAPGAFPAHLLLKSNVYGAHEVGGRTVSKPTVVNFFVDRALRDEPLTVYEPGTQARNYVHVDDVARAYVRCVERLVDQRAAGETGVERYEIASGEDPCVRSVAETVRRLAREELGRDVPVTLVENPRDEALVESFPVDTTRARTRLGWEPRRTLEASIRDLLRAGADGDGP